MPMALHPVWRAFVPGALALALLAACTPPADDAARPTTAVAAEAAGGGQAGEYAGVLSAAVDALRARIIEQVPGERLADLTPDEAIALATHGERQVLSTGFLGFSVDAPATVHVLLSPDSDIAPFWLGEQGFEPSGLDALVDGDDDFRGWSRQVPAGEVALGVPSIEMGVKPYIVVVAPAGP